MYSEFEIGIIFPDNIAISQLDIWKQYLLKSPYKTCIFAQKCSKTISDKIPFPIFTIEDGFSIYEVEKFKNLEFLLYPTNRSKNFNWLLKFPHLKHIFIGHGDSEKHSSSSRIINAYDFAMMSDIDSYKRYIYAGVNIDIAKCLFMGVPTQEGIEFRNNINNNIRSILYAPTFEGNSPNVNYSSLAKIHHIIFSEKFDIIFRPHPGTGKRDNEYKNIILKYEKSKLSKVQQFNKSDVMICDISGIKNEYLFTGKPIIIPATKNELNRYIINSIDNYCYIWDYNNISLNDFIKIIEYDEKYSNRIKYRNMKYLRCENFDDSLNLFIKQLDFTRKNRLSRWFLNSLLKFRQFQYKLSPSKRSRLTHVEEDSIMDNVNLTAPDCPVCGSSARETQIDKKEMLASVSEVQHLFICNNCHFVNFPSNTTKELNLETDKSGHRAGSLDKPGREYFYFEAISNYIFPNKKISVCIYGAGLSYDHHHIRSKDNVLECYITDLQNYQESNFFIDNPIKKFDLVIASEVIEHFENPIENFNHLLSFVSDSGLLLIGTNIHIPGTKIDKLKYPFLLGHCSYWSPESLNMITSRLKYKLFFMNTSFGGPRKRAVFIFKNEDIINKLILLTGKKQIFI